jgi:hypothetical protein
MTEAVMRTLVIGLTLRIAMVAAVGPPAVRDEEIAS